MKCTCFLFVVVLLYSCSTNLNVNKCKEVTEKYYQYLMKNDYDSVVTLFSPEFFSKTDTNELKYRLKKSDKLRGKILADYCCKTTSTSESGLVEKGIITRVEIYYKVTQEKNISKEVFIFKNTDKNVPLIDSIKSVDWKDGDDN